MLGLSVGPALESADAVAVRTNGFGLAMTPRVVGTARLPLARQTSAADAGETLAQAVRQLGGEVSSALAAGLLGADRVFACDIDAVAVEIAGRGFVGSVDAVAPGVADLVVANISPEAIEVARVLHQRRDLPAVFARESNHDGGL